MAKKKSLPEPKPYEFILPDFNSLVQVRAYAASLYGLISRVHGQLGLHGEDPKDRISALEKWCNETDKDKRRIHPDGHAAEQ